MGILNIIGRLFSGSSKDEAVSQMDSFVETGKQTTERVHRQGINPMVRNADDDYCTVATNYTAANRLARDCARK